MVLSSASAFVIYLSRLRDHRCNTAAIMLKDALVNGELARFSTLNTADDALQVLHRNVEISSRLKAAGRADM